MSQLPRNPSESFKRLNAALYQTAIVLGADSKPTALVSKRVRQSSKPVMNKLEQEWFDLLSAMFPNFPRPRAQAKKYKIGNNAWYKPDITCSFWPQEDGPACETAFECKGPKHMKNIDRGILALKVAAHAWPEVAFWICWKDNGKWITQKVLP